jgi:hypothetical protein
VLVERAGPHDGAAALCWRYGVAGVLLSVGFATPDRQIPHLGDRFPPSACWESAAQATESSFVSVRQHSQFCPVWAVEAVPPLGHDTAALTTQSQCDEHDFRFSFSGSLELAPQGVILDDTRDTHGHKGVGRGGWGIWSICLKQTCVGVLAFVLSILHDRRAGCRGLQAGLCWA